MGVSAMQVEALQAVGFMYMRPPGYNAESARAAEIADERKKLGLDAPPSSSQDASLAVATQRYFTQTVGNSLCILLQSRRAYSCDSGWFPSGKLPITVNVSI